MLANRPDTIEEPVYYKQILTYSVIVVAGRTAARLGRPRPAGLVTRDDRARPARRDVLVVDLTRALAGPHATMMLGDLGARVIKVEAPGHGRRHPRLGAAVRRRARGRPRVDVLPVGQPQQGVDRPRPQGRRRPATCCCDLVDRADVLVENFRTGVLDRLGLGIATLHELNPRLVVLSITGFGHDGPEGGRAGYDQIAQGEAGLMSLTGSGPDDPQRVGVPIADLLAGMYGAYGVLAALHERDAHRRRARSCAPRCWPRPSACTPSRAPAGPSPARSAGRRATTTRRSRRTACSTAATAPCRSRVGSEGLWRRFCAGFGLDPATPRAGHQRRAGRPTASGSIAVVEAAFADWDGRAAARPARRGRRPGRQGAHARRGLRAGTRPRSQGLLVDVEHADARAAHAARPAAAVLRPAGRPR